MSIKSRLKKLDAAAAPLRRRRAVEEAEAAWCKEFNEHLQARGLPLVNSFREMTEDQLDDFCRFHGIDIEREEYDLPCDSWRFKGNLDQKLSISYWHSAMRRGEMTRDEYHRRVLELAGLPPPEASSSSSGG